MEKLRPQLVDLLVCLAKRPGEIVLKEEILAEVWPAQYVVESALSRCIAELRQILGDDVQQPRYIETVTKRGYRLVAPVVWVGRSAVPEVPPDVATVETQEPGPGPVPAEELSRGPEPSLAERPSSPRARSWMAAGAGVVLVIIAVVAWFTQSRADVLTERDTVLLAFENLTGDVVFDETIPLAMSIQMEQSPYLALLSPGRVQETLRMMQRPPDTPMTRAAGMEICERAGARALIVTSIALLGRQYAIGIEAIECGTGAVLARRQVTADRTEDVLGGLQRAAIEIRRAVGEPAASLRRYDVPIVEATTSSLDALRALRQGDAARERGEMIVAARLYREAASLDPDFALAYSRLGTILGGHEPDRLAACEKAYALKARVTLPERLEIEAMYHRYVTGDRPKIVEALEALTGNYPRRTSVRRALAVEYQQTGQHDAALAEALEAARLEPRSAMNLTTVALAYLYLNRLAEARSSAEQAMALGGAGPWVHLVLFECALAAGDQAAVARERQWAADHRDAGTPEILLADAEESVNRGRLREALGLLGQLEAYLMEREDAYRASVVRLWMARLEAMAGFRLAALRRLDDEMRRGLLAETKATAAGVLVAAGEVDRATRLLDEIERSGGPGWLQAEPAIIGAYRAAIDIARNQPDRAVARLAPFEPYDLGTTYAFVPLFERARAHQAAGNWTLARAAFEKILAHPTIYTGRSVLPFAELGLARTLVRAGDTAAGRRVYEQLFDRWRGADPDLPILLEARREYQALDQE